jgi:hypothetical protein
MINKQLAIESAISKIEAHIEHGNENSTFLENALKDLKQTSSDVLYVTSIISGQKLPATEITKSRIRNFLGLRYIKLLVIGAGLGGLRVTENWYKPNEIFNYTSD